jgi:pyruvate-ferredoxin/flavodoxin oxidoreductase
MGNDNLTDPFIGLGTMPAVTALFRDMTGIRFQHPEWIPENCTACGNCYTVCPDTAIPGLVSRSAGPRHRAQAGEEAAAPTEAPAAAVRTVEKKLRAALAPRRRRRTPLAELLDEAVGDPPRPS